MALKGKGKLMSEGLRISLVSEDIKQLEFALEAGLNELEAWEERDSVADPLDANVVGSLRRRFWHAHGTISGVADALSSLRGQIEELQKPPAGSSS